MNRTAQQLRGLDRAVSAYRLAALGRPHHEIARELNCSRSAVTRAVKRGRALVIAEFKAEARTDLIEQLATVQALFSQALASFEESRHPAPRKRSSHRDNGAGGDESRMNSIDVQETSPGVVGFLRVATTLLAERSKLLGLYPPQQVRIDVPDGRQFEQTPKEQLQREIADLWRQSGMDPAMLLP